MARMSRFDDLFNPLRSMDPDGLLRRDAERDFESERRHMRRAALGVVLSFVLMFGGLAALAAFYRPALQATAPASVRG